jgi:hypothetical protein
MGGAIERRRVPFNNDLDGHLSRRGKDAFGLDAQNRAPTLPHHGDDDLEFPPRSALDSEDDRTVPHGVLETSSRKWFSMTVPVIRKST